MSASCAPSASQVRVSGEVVRWYLRTYFRTPHDPGLASMFCDPSRVGAFAVSADGLMKGSPGEFFRLLVATSMFQRRQDVQILRILRGISEEDARELSSSEALLALVDAGGCELMRDAQALRERCDLSKDARGVGCCAANPHVACHLKRHTVLLKRYGHFGKVPSSAALLLRERGADGLPALFERVCSGERTRRARALALEAALAGIWRVSQKIASMYLSSLLNPDLGVGHELGSRVEWQHYVVIDSNVDLFLRSIRYRGTGTYDARRAFVQSLARAIDLRSLDRKLHRYNPRLVQQAFYLFMSEANRRASPIDCMHLSPPPCSTCPSTLRSRCPVRPVSRPAMPPRTRRSLPVLR